MMNGEMKQYVVCLCLILFAGLFTSTFVVTGHTSPQLQCIASSAAMGLQDTGISCSEQCDAECEPGHWYSWLCRGVCVLGCSGMPPEFPGVYELPFPGR